jgi:thioredoxin 1
VNTKTTMNAMVIELDESNFNEEVLQAQEPVIVQFWANWSTPCKVMTPLIESVAEDRIGEVKVARVNVERNESLADQYGVRAVPTMLFFNRGRLRDQIIGRANERELHDKLRRFA